jgi:hypothetical protein
MNTTSFRRPERTSWQADATLAAADQQRLVRLMQHELGLYNVLNETLRAKLRSDPALLARMPERQAKAFVTAVGASLQLREVRSRGLTTAVLPAALEPFRTLLFNAGEDAMERPRFESLMGLFEAAGQPGRIHPEIRRAMAEQILAYYQTQALTAAEELPASVRQEQVYRNPITLLESFDLSRKRHVQLHRRHLTLRYDEAADRTLIKTPYTVGEIAVQGDIARRIAFSHAIFHQKPGRMPVHSTPWSIDFRKAETPYLLSYVESSRVDDGRAFHHMARQSRSAV